MPHLLGLSFTSPVVVTPYLQDVCGMAVYLYGSSSGLHEFVVANKAKTKILFVTTIPDLRTVLAHEDIAHIRGVVVYEDVSILRQVEGVRLLDASESNDWRQLNVNVADLSDTLKQAAPAETPVISFSSKDNAAISAELSAPATCRELVERIATVLDSDQDTVRRVCARYAVKLIDKDVWIRDVVGPYRKKFTSTEALLEFERFVDLTEGCTALWSAFYDVVVDGSDTGEAAVSRGADLADLLYLVRWVPTATTYRFLQVPVKTKTKRRRTTKKEKSA